MKRFKNSSNINTGDRVSKETLSPRSIYSQTTPHMSPGGIHYPSPPPIKPAQPSLTAIPELHPLFKTKLKDALEVIYGKLQIDEVQGLQKSGVISGLTAAMMAIPKLQILGHGISQIGTIILQTQAFAFVINAVKPALRGWFARNIYSLPELQLIKKKKYDFKIFDMVPDSNGVLVPSPTAKTKQMTLEELGDIFSAGGNVVDDLIVFGKKGYAFANDTDVDNINKMFKANDTSNKIDSAISGVLPFAAPAVTFTYLGLKISGSDAAKKAAAEDEKSKNPGTYSNPTPQQILKQKAAKEKYLKDLNQKYGPKS